MSENSQVLLDSLFEGRSSLIARDLKLNLSRLLNEGALASVEASLALLATASAVQSSKLKEVAQTLVSQHDLSVEQVQEAAESAAIMGMLNTYYSFRYKVSQGDEVNAQNYQTAGLRMNSLAKPALGKERFEMLSFAVSVINGCETCIRAHEKALKELQVSVEKIHDLAKLAAVAKGFSVL
jgi:alkyl hydroperoxide reductase subunit D